MADRPSDSPQDDHEVDWNAVRDTVRSAVQSQLGRAQAQLVEDLTQQALIGVLRVLRRESARNVHALARSIARATAIDEIRRLQRERRGLRELGAEISHEALAATPSADGIEASSELLWFLLVEYFRTRNAPCHPLAVLYSEKGEWQAVAEALNMTHDAVRKQWSRCTQAFRQALRRDPGPFKDWLDDV